MRIEKITMNAKVSIARLSIISNTLLISMKLVVGLISGSVSILSEAIHSSMDLIAAIIAFFLSGYQITHRIQDIHTDTEKLKTFQE